VANRNRLNVGSVQKSGADINLTSMQVAVVDKPRFQTVPQKVQQTSNGTLNTELFGYYQDLVSTYPNDVVRLDIENVNNQYLESNFRVKTYTKTNTEVTFNPELDLSNLGYVAGKYKVSYKFHRNLLGAGDAHKLQIQEVSADGSEIRVVPVLSTEYDNENFIATFADKLFGIPKAQTLTNLFLFKNATTALRVFDYVQDKFTYPDSPYSVIFKLNASLPDGVSVGDLLWLSQQVSDDLIDYITITPPKIKSDSLLIAGPDWDAFRKDTTTVSTQYKDWDDLLSTNTQTAQSIVASLLSGSLLEGVSLNIDYKTFDNHIHFGSAVERLLNFKYKIELLESYDTRISALTSGLNGLLSGSASSSVYYQSNVLDAKNKKTALLGSLDGYEKYLYYQSSSYVSNSYGEFYPSTWPKSNSSYPYVNYSYSSSQVENWFDGIVYSASVYDQNNSSALSKTIPAHIVEDNANEGYVLFTSMIGHYFDLVYGYIKAFSDVSNRNESLLEGFSKDLVYGIAKNLGVDFENGAALDELWSYTLGTDSTGSLATTYGITTEDKTKEIWKRIISNLPYLLKTKGTERGVRALISCFGIPRTILRIREYGGSEPDFDTKTDYVYDRFSYSTTIGYNGRTSGNVCQRVGLSWKQDTLQTLVVPVTIEARVKMAPNQTKTQRLMERPGSWYIEASKSGDSQYLTFYLGDNQDQTNISFRYTSNTHTYLSASVSCSVYDGNWHHMALTRHEASDGTKDEQAYTLQVRSTNYEKVVSAKSSSLVINGNDPSQEPYNAAFVATGPLYIYPSTTLTVNDDTFLWLPVSGTFAANESHSMAVWSGSVQEVRYWNTKLQDSILDNHALAPTSYQGNLSDTYTGSTSSFNSLWMRLPLGSDTKKLPVTGSGADNGILQLSAHPNQQLPVFDTIYYSFSGSIHKPVVETYSLEWPDIGTNRSIGNKIRIDDTFVAGNNQLRVDTSVVRSLLDNYPIDSPRLGVYLSPTNEINEDIAEQFGGLSIDDYIGTPSDLSKNYYTGLDDLKREYFKKYTARNKAQNYIRLIKHYDASLFQLIKKFVPYRANTQVGLVVEPHILDRSKIAVNPPTYESLYYTSSIVVPEIYTPGGFVEDADGEPFRNSSGYVQEGVIGNDTMCRLPVQKYDMVVIDGTSISTTASFLRSTANEFSGIGVDDNPSTSGSMAGEVNLGISAYGRDTRVQGSQYVFMSYMQSGSGTTISAPYLYTSSRYDYHECLPPMVQTSRYSAVSNVSANVYDVDIYGGKAFGDWTAYGFGATSTTVTEFTSSATLQLNNWTANYGLDIVSLYSSSTSVDPVNSPTNGYWSIRSKNDSTAQGLAFRQGSAASLTPLTASVRIPAFFYKANDPSTQDYLYKVTISTDETLGYAEPINKLELHFGDLDCALTASITPTSTQTDVTFTTKALGNWLGLRLYVYGLSSTYTWIPKLSVECLNYRADVQDYHLRDSYGMRTARYDGSKLTSPDWNVDSPDTVDNGPVVVVTVGGGKQLSVSPNTRGTFKIK
jgi:hypothetical protein